MPLAYACDHVNMHVLTSMSCYKMTRCGCMGEYAREREKGREWVASEACVEICEEGKADCGEVHAWESVPRKAGRGGSGYLHKGVWKDATKAWP